MSQDVSNSNEANSLKNMEDKPKSRPMDIGTDSQEVTRIIQELDETADGKADDFNELYEDDQASGAKTGHA